MVMDYTQQLSSLRTEINELDRILIDCFRKRMDTAAAIAALKMKNNLEILDAVRERQVIDRASAMAPPELQEDAAALMRFIMELSKGYQSRIMAKAMVQEGS